MIVNNKLNLPQRQQPKTAFKGYDYFQQIKALPKVVCGCCGRETLHTDKYIRTVTPLAKPLSVQIENGVLSYLERKFPKVWETIQSFTERFPGQSLDEIIHSKDDSINEYYVELKKSVVDDIDSQKEVYNLSGIERDRFVGKTFYDLTDNSRAYMASSAEVIKRLLPIKHHLTGVKKEVFEQFEIYSRKFPDKTLSEIVNDPQIRQFHSTKNILQRIETREKLDYHFENILLLVQEKNPEAVETFQKLKEDTLEMYNNEGDAKRRNYLAEKMYKDALKQHGCESIEEKVLNELRQVPETFMTKDSFFNHAANKKYTDGQIVTVLFSHILASEEHVLTIHDGGQDITGNKIIMCRECNTKRKSIPYKEFIRYHVEMPKNTQKQLDIIAENILNGNLSSKLRPYPVNIAENLDKTSEGTINLDIKDYCEKIIEQSEEKVSKNQEDISQFRREREEVDIKIAKLVNSNLEETTLQQDIKKYLDKTE